MLLIKLLQMPKQFKYRFVALLRLCIFLFDRVARLFGAYCQGACYRGIGTFSRNRLSKLGKTVIA